MGSSPNGLTKAYERIIELLRMASKARARSASYLLDAKGKACEYHSASVSGNRLSITLFFPVESSSGFKPLSDNALYGELLWRGYYLSRVVSQVKVEVKRTPLPGILQVELIVGLPEDRYEAALKIASVLKAAESILEEGRVPMGIIGM